MKKTILYVVFLLSGTGAFSQIAREAVAAQQPRDLKGDFLLRTQWDQWGAYAQYTPDNHVLGCWSTSLAQILYYHRLKPHGIVDYNCSKGYRIREDLSAFPVHWEDFSDRITKESTPEKQEAVARYSFLTAAAIRKDFGTGKYLEMVNPAPQIEQHFECRAEFYVSFTGDLPFTEEQLKGIARKEGIRHVIDMDSIRVIVKREIDLKRPVYLHMGNFTTYGHSTVIDGYLEKEGVFYVHINYGSSGFRTGWYDLFKPVDVEDDMKLRAFVTIQPGKGAAGS